MRFVLAVVVGLHATAVPKLRRSVKTVGTDGFDENRLFRVERNRAEGNFASTQLIYFVPQEDVTNAGFGIVCSPEIEQRVRPLRILEMNLRSVISLNFNSRSQVAGIHTLGQFGLFRTGGNPKKGSRGRENKSFYIHIAFFMLNIIGMTGAKTVEVPPLRFPIFGRAMEVFR